MINIDFDKPAQKSYYAKDDVKIIIVHVVGVVGNLVVSTMGPDGKLAVISYGTEPKTTKDGVTVARSIKFNNEAAEYINRIITEAALKTDEECGDGTTTTIFLTRLLYQVLEKYNTFPQQKQVESIVNFMIEQLTKMAFVPQVEDKVLYDLALTSSNNDENIANAIINAYRSAKDGFPQIEMAEGYSSQDVIEAAAGLPLRMMFSNPAFSNKGWGENSEYTDFIAIGVDSILRADNPHAVSESLKVLEDLEKSYPGKVIFLVCRSAEIDFCNVALRAGQSTKTRFIPLTTGFGGSMGTLLMGDIMSALNGRVFNSLMDINTQPHNICVEKLQVGSERSILLTKNNETAERIEGRLKEIQTTIDESQSGDRYSTRIKFNQRRIRDLTGELITIFVGGETTSEVKERKDRFVDVNKAVKSALENGVLPGAGYAMRQVGVALAEKMESETDFEKAWDREIILDMIRLCYAQYEYLFENSELFDWDNFRYAIEKADVGMLEKDFSVYHNLATGKTGVPADIGIFDTAYASITALKGGFKTAKILSKTDTILLGSKLGAQRI